MRHIVDFLEDCFATPANTSGMGNPMAPEGNTPGSGDIPQCIDIKTGKIYKRRKKLKRYKL